MQFRRDLDALNTFLKGILRKTQKRKEESQRESFLVPERYIQNIYKIIYTEFWQKYGWLKAILKRSHLEMRNTLQDNGGKAISVTKSRERRDLYTSVL